MNKRSVFAVGWALFGMPLLFAALAFGVSSPEMDWIGDRQRLVAWIGILVLSLWLGARPLLAVFPVSRVAKLGLAIVYAAFMYFALLGIGFIAMCAHGCS